jgi:hypothetical protein
MDKEAIVWMYLTEICRRRELGIGTLSCNTLFRSAFALLFVSTYFPLYSQRIEFNSGGIHWEMPKP